MYVYVAHVGLLQQSRHERARVRHAARIDHIVEPTTAQQDSTAQIDISVGDCTDTQHARASPGGLR